MIAARPLRLLLAVPAPGLRGAMAELLSGSGVDLVVEVAPEPAEVAGVAGAVAPDVLVLTEQALGPQPAAALGRLRALVPGCEIVVVSVDASRPMMSALRSAGAHAVRAEALARDLPPLLGDLSRRAAPSDGGGPAHDRHDERDACADAGP